MIVYVFGAGASAPYGAPTMSRFLLEAFSPWMTIPRQSTSFDNELETVAGTINDQYGLDLGKALSQGEVESVLLEKINIEQLLAYANETEHDELRKALEIVIYRTIEESIKSYWGRRGEYQMLLDQLVPTGVPNEIGLISLNYDLILDRALTDKAREQTFNWSYDIAFKAGVEHFPTYPREGKATIHLLKLHGSLNWCRCVGCNEFRLYSFQRYENIFRTSWPPCESCNESQFSPVLVAPTLVKRYPEKLDDAWNKAAECLKAARALIVIGYSFPTADQRIRDLFLRNFIVPNLRSSQRPKLTLVIRDECIRKAMESWFLPAVDKTVSEYCSFEEYCAVLQKSVP